MSENLRNFAKLGQLFLILPLVIYQSIDNKPHINFLIAENDVVNCNKCTVKIVQKILEWQVFKIFYFLFFLVENFWKMQKFEQHQIIEKFEKNIDSVFRQEFVRLINIRGSLIRLYHLEILIWEDLDFHHRMKRPAKSQESTSQH